ncbi:MAG TPA: hypothetical protein EYP07_10735, partial [Kiloniellaceae bacterium]|nr:hypothetical protein [Kiloniellaceae bacterium]
MIGPEQGTTRFPIAMIGRASRLTRAVAAMVFGLSLFQPWSGIGSAKADEAGYQVRSFSAGPAWFVYEGEIDAALYVPKPNALKCHEIGEIILLFENREQLLNEALINDAALAAMSHYTALCASLGARGSNQRNVIGVMADGPPPSEQGRYPVADQILSAYVTSLGRRDGGYSVVVRRNTVLRDQQRTADRGELIKQRKDQQDRLWNGDSESSNEPQASTSESNLEDMRMDYQTRLALSTASAQPVGLVQEVLGGRQVKLTGIWSGSQAECGKERLILFQNGDRGTAEWWRLASERIGLLPSRSGTWELRDGTLIMSFDEKVEQSFTSGGI